MTGSFLKQICAEPYRLFFPLGILIALAGVGHWIFYAAGWMPHYSAYFHSSIQTQGYMVCFVVGFLMTAMPRFSSAKTAQTGEVLAVLALILGNAAALSFGKWIAAQVCFSGVLISLLLFAAKRVGAKSQSKSSGVSPPLEFVWVPIAVLHGLTGSFLMVLNQMEKLPASWIQAAKLMNEQGFILCIVIGIGGFLAPRLMGTFRVYAKPGQMPNDPALLKIKKRVLIFHIICGALFFASFWIGVYHLRASYFLRAAIITAQYFWTCSFLRFPKTTEFYAKLLWISLWMVVAGSWLTFFLPQYRSAMLHVLFIGGLSLMIFAVATMVIFSHGGAPEQLRKPLPALWIVGAGVFASLGLRLTAAFLPEHYFKLLGASATVWVLGSAVWFFLTVPKIAVSLSHEELERCHEDAKERVAKLRDPAPKKQGECCGHEGHCQ